MFRFETDSNMNPTIAALIDDFDRIPTMTEDDRKAAMNRAATSTDLLRDDPSGFLRGVCDKLPFKDEKQNTLLAMYLAGLVARDFQQASNRQQSEELSLPTDDISILYKHLDEADRSRPQLLQWLAAVGGMQELALFADLVESDPPTDETSVMLAFSPLFQKREFDPTPLFPKLFNRLDTLSVAATILDLANHLTRESYIATHPATSRSTEIITLLGGLIKQLTSLEGQDNLPEASPEDLSRQISESVAMVVSLCDALALMVESAAIEKLHEAMNLSHRRIRTEAAGALAKLGEREGETALLELAAEPVARLRVIAYAEELGIEEKIAEQHRSILAVAEAELCLWLAQPTQFGIPPTMCELFEQRTMYWPSYEQPVECFLFRFEYAFGEQSHSNIGISGPLTHAFKSDLANLPPDDIFAIFAGWQAEHEEIREMSIDQLSPEQRVDVARFERRLQDDQYSEIEPEIFATFFGDKVLTARAQRNGKKGTAIVDADRTSWFPSESSHRPIGPSEAYCIYKGRELLRTFNQP